MEDSNKSYINVTHFLDLQNSKVYNRLFNVYHEVNLPLYLNSPSIIHKGRTFLIGGGVHPYNRCFLINSIDFHAENIPSLLQGRRNHGLVVHLGDIFAIGGKELNYLSSVEKFNGSKWTTQASLNFPRADATCLSVNNHVYVVGGVVVHNFIEKFDGQTWEILKISLPIRLKDIGYFICNDEIYLVGGKLLDFRSDASTKKIFVLRSDFLDVESLPVVDSFKFSPIYEENSVELIGRSYRFQFNLKEKKWKSEKIEKVCKSCFSSCSGSCLNLKRLNFIKLYSKLKFNSK